MSATLCGRKFGARALSVLGLWLCFAPVAWADPAGGAGSGAPKPPNILFILTDDQGYGDVSALGNPILKTPSIDRLYAESARFTDFMVSPSCAPSRAALMTGMHEFKGGVTHTVNPWRRLNPASTTVAQILKSAGYHTGIFGKWHLGDEGEYRPEQRGFDESLTAVNDTQNEPVNPVLLRNGQREKFTGYRDNILFDEAMKFIEKHKDGPFFCYLPTYDPHRPHTPPANVRGLYGRKGGKETGLFFEEIANIDQNIGRMLDHLATLGIEKQTLVVLMNDNGATDGIDVWNADMRGHKGTAWLGGTRALSFWRWPGHIKPRDLPQMAAHVDVLPTLAAFAGAAIPEKIGPDLDGRSLRPLLLEESTDWPDRTLITNVARWRDGQPDTHKYDACRVRNAQFDLVQIGVGKSESNYTKDSKFHSAATPGGKWALYDRHEDPGCKHNVADEHPDVVRQLSQTYEDWWAAVRPRLVNERGATSSVPGKPADEE